MKGTRTLLTTVGILVALGGSARATTITGDANTIILNPAPTSVAPNSLTSNTKIYGWAEQQGFTLTQSLVVDANAAGSYNGGQTYSTSTISAGTIVNSFLLHYDKVSGNPTITANFTFSSQILGLIFTVTNLDASDLLRPLGQSMNVGGQRGLDDSGDIVISNDLRTLTFIAGGTNIDQVRVITDIASVPEPGTYALIGTGIMTLGLIRRKRKV